MFATARAFDNENDVLKFSETHIYLKTLPGRLASLIHGSLAQLKAEPNTPVEIVEKIKKLYTTLSLLIEDADTAFRKIPEPGYWNPLPYGQALIETAYQLIGKLHGAIFQIYQDLYQAGFLTQEEIEKFAKLDETFTKLEKNCHALLRLGLVSAESFDFQSQREQLHEMVKTVPDAYKPSIRRAFANSHAFQGFTAQFASLLKEVKQKFTHLTMDYRALTLLWSEAQGIILSSLDSVETALSALPDFQYAPPCSPSHEAILPNFERRLSMQGKEEASPLIKRPSLRLRTLALAVRFANSLN